MHTKWEWVGAELGAANEMRWSEYQSTVESNKGFDFCYVRIYSCGIAYPKRLERNALSVVPQKQTAQCGDMLQSSAACWRRDNPRNAKSLAV